MLFLEKEIENKNTYSLYGILEKIEKRFDFILKISFFNLKILCFDFQKKLLKCLVICRKYLQLIDKKKIIDYMVNLMSEI